MLGDDPERGAQSTADSLSPKFSFRISTPQLCFTAILGWGLGVCSLTRRSRLSSGAAAGQGGGLQAWHRERRASGSKRPAAAHRSPPPAEGACTALAERGSERVATRPHTSGFRAPNLKTVLADWSLARRGLTGTKRLERANHTNSLVG